MCVVTYEALNFQPQPFYQYINSPCVIHTKFFSNENKAIDHTEQLISDEKQNSATCLQRNYRDTFRIIQQYVMWRAWG